MPANNERIAVQIRDLTYIAERIDTAKGRLRYGTPEWNCPDLAEARLMALSAFTAFGRDLEGR